MQVFSAIYPPENKFGSFLRTIVSKVTLVGSVVGLPVVSVGAALARVRGRLGGQLSACGVAAGTGRLRTERFAPPTGVLLLLLLLLEGPMLVSVSPPQQITPQHLQPLRSSTVTCLFLMRSLLLGHFVELVQLPGSKLGELGHKYPEVPTSGNRGSAATY